MNNKNIKKKFKTKNFFYLEAGFNSLVETDALREWFEDLDAEDLEEEDEELEDELLERLLRFIF